MVGDRQSFMAGEFGGKCYNIVISPTVPRQVAVKVWGSILGNEVESVQAKPIVLPLTADTWVPEASGCTMTMNNSLAGLMFLEADLLPAQPKQRVSSLASIRT